MTGKAKENIIWSAIDDEVMLLDVSSGEFYSLNETAAAVWQGLQRGDSAARIAESLVGTYGVDPAIAQHDVEELIAELRNMGLLH